MSKAASVVSDSMSRRLLAILVILLMTASMLVATASAGSATGETPAERCARETSAYNAAWAASWAAANPGKDPSQAPPPAVPYLCVDPGKLRRRRLRARNSKRRDYRRPHPKDRRPALTLEHTRRQTSRPKVARQLFR